jgi:hypothetical protein
MDFVGYQVERAAVAPRAGLCIQAFGPRGDLIDEGGHFREAYAVSPGDWVVVRPDGYIGAIVGSQQLHAPTHFFGKQGLI